MTANPKISVLMPSYNHGRFIEVAIRSVLAQTYTDYELIIVDDGSSDNSCEKIAGISDPRIKVKILRENVGACEAMNIALAMSKGAYIAVCNSDDEWNPKKLEIQKSFLDQNGSVSAVFSNVIWINDHGEVLGESATPYFHVFRQKNRSRWNWLRDLLENGNCLCHSSVLIRREVYEKLGNYDNRFRQLPDLYMWTKVVQQGDIFVMPDKLVAFRLHDSNTSAPSKTSSARSINEHSVIVRETFAGITPLNFFQSFGLKGISVPDGTQLEIEKALYLIEHTGLYRNMFREIGMEAIYDLMKNPETRSLLSEKFNFNFPDLYKYAGERSVWLPPTVQLMTDPYEAVRGIYSAALSLAVSARVRTKSALKRIIDRGRREPS
jgi:glycosyltransferase involved in cell wall biosynthesis